MHPILCSLRFRALLGMALTTAFAGGLCAQTTWYVSASSPGGGTGTGWNSPFQDLQAAIAVAQPGDAIWVAAGTYRPSVLTIPGDPRSATFELPHNVSIYGGFRGTELTLAQRQGWFDQTVLSGDIGVLSSVFDNCYHVVTLNGTNQFITTGLDGFTIRDGYGLGGPGTPSRGAGITVKAGGATHGPQLISANLRVRSNIADQGGGIAVTNLGAVIMCNSLVADNGAEDAGGGAYVLTGWLWTASTRWQSNVAVNRGGALFTNSTTTNMVRVTNDVFFGNQSNLGGAIYVAGAQFIHGTVEVASCTIACNFANAGVSIYADTNQVQPAKVTVHNSILWHEPPTGPATLAGAGNSVTVSYSCVLGGFAGVGNISSNPQFVDWPNGDLRLASGSGCIDAGNSNLVPNDYCDVDGDGNFGETLPLDIEGGRRTIDDPNTPDTGVGNPVVDMGAYEF